MTDDKGREQEHGSKRWMDQVRRFWSHPTVQIGQWVVAILLGAVLGYFVAIWAEKMRELTYYVHPLRARVVKAGEASQLAVTYAGQELTTDVTAVQVQMWNQGCETIEKADILRPLVLNTADHTPILEAVIRQQTRPDIVRLQLDAAEQKRGRLGVSWEVLEEGDGGIVQLILAGTPDVKVSAEAALKGQRQIREVTFPQHIVSPEQQYDVLRRRSSVWLWGWLGFWLAFTGFNVYALSTERRRWARAQELLEKYLNPLPDELLQRVSFTHLPRWKRWARYVGPLAFILVGVYMVWLFLTALLTTFPPTPPLDF